MVQKQRIMFPGETITTEEEYASGPNTYTQKGLIKARTVGEAILDDTTKEALIKGKNINELQKGDIVIGKVMLVKESQGVIELLSAENGKKITGIKTAQLPIRNVSTEYITELRRILKIGDLIRARIDTINPLGIDLVTNEKGLGVIKAYCSNCRKEMQYTNQKLMCINCGSIEERKWFEAEQKPREFNSREGNHDGGYNRGFNRNHTGFQRGTNNGFSGRRNNGFNSGPRRENNFRTQRNNRYTDRKEHPFGSERGFNTNRDNRGFNKKRIGPKRDYF